MARLLAYIVHKTQPEAQRLTMLNVAGRGQPLTFAQCIEMAHAKLGSRARKMGASVRFFEFLWKFGISAIPPEAQPYMTGEYTMNTERLHRFLGEATRT